MINNDDKYYIEKVLKGHSDAYAFIINKYKSIAFTLALRVLRNREDAEEAAQDAFVKSYYALSEFNSKSAFSTWLYRIVYTCAISRLRQRKPAMRELDEETIESAGADFNDTNSALNKMKSEDQKHYVNLAMESLEEEDSLILTLYYQLEKSAEEIAQITGLTRSNVKIKLFRIRKKLQHTLENILKEEVYNLL